jgi:hypothetical protein
MHKNIKTKSLEGRLSGPITDEIVKQFSTYCENGEIDGVLLRGGEFTLNKTDNKIIHLNSGLLTLQGHLGLPIERTHSLRPAPERWLGKMFPNGVDESKILYRLGQKFTDEAINTVVKIHKTKAKNAKIDSCKDAKQAVDEGIIEFSQYNVIQNAKEAIADAKLNREVGSRPKLYGDLTLTFAKWTDSQKVPGTEKEVTFRGLPGNEFEKRKNYFIYSKRAGYGKTTTVRQELVKRYSAHIINDLNNAVGVPKNLQWLVFDEYSRTKKLDLGMLKTLANGDASGAYLNRKSHGGSYIPPSDVQVIVLGNYSPYEIYAQWDKKTQRHIISEEVLSTIVDRFFIVRLDGDDTEERRKFMEPATWTKDEFQIELRELRNRCLKGKADTVETVEFITRAVQMYKGRTADGRSLPEFIEDCLCDGNDILLARMLYHDSLKRVKEPRLDTWRRKTAFGVPPSGEEIIKGLIAMRNEMGDQSTCDTRWLDAAIAFPKQYAKYVYERVLPERPEPQMTIEDLDTVCMTRGKKRRHSECL